MTRLQEVIRQVLQDYTEYLGWDEETYKSIYGIAKDKLPQLEEWLTKVIQLHYPMIQK